LNNSRAQSWGSNNANEKLNVTERPFFVVITVDSRVSELIFVVVVSIDNMIKINLLSKTFLSVDNRT